MSWNKFPLEIRSMILQDVVDCEEDRPHFPKYATVSLEFQLFLEPVCFQAITFTGITRILEVNNIITPRRRRYVHSVSLEYEIKLRGTEIATCRRHDISFTIAVWQLFRELSTWEPTPKGLRLELSACQGVLNRGNFTYGCRSSRGTGQNLDVGVERWTPFGQDEAPLLDFDQISEFDDMYESLPLVEAVTSLAIRKHEGFHLSYEKTILNLGPVLASLPKLQQFRHDYWRGVKRNPSSSQRNRSTQEYQSIVLKQFSTLPCLRRVTIFEDFTCCFRDELRDIQQSRLAEALAQSSRGLEQLHLARNIDAIDFFSAFVDTDDTPVKRLGHGGWPKMRFLSMTAASLLEGNELEPLLQGVAAAAETMPCLEVLELWAVANNKGPDLKRRKQAGVFRYDRLSERPRLTLLTTWKGSIDDDTKTAWTSVADKHDTRHPLTIETVTVCATSVQSHLDVLKHLALKNRLLPDERGSEPFLFCSPPKQPIEIDPITGSSRPATSHSAASPASQSQPTASSSL